MIKPITIKDLHQSVRGVLRNVLGRYSVYACPVGATEDEDHQFFILQHSTPQTTENRY